MRRADRLFEIIQILRRSSRPLTAAAIAAEAEVARRTIYRDVAALIAQGVPIRGEAGIGYVLDKGFDLPPLMLTADEIEAATLGAQWVAGHAEPALARAARDLIAKIAHVVPAHFLPLIDDATARTAPAWGIEADGIDVAKARQWARIGNKIALRYRDARDTETRRIVWPVAIGYAENRRTLIAWCERRGAFRDFRLDRVIAADYLPERFPDRPAALRRRWLDEIGRRRARLADAQAAVAGKRGTVDGARSDPAGVERGRI